MYYTYKHVFRFFSNPLTHFRNKHQYSTEKITNSEPTNIVDELKSVICGWYLPKNT